MEFILSEQSARLCVYVAIGLFFFLIATLPSKRVGLHYRAVLVFTIFLVLILGDLLRSPDVRLMHILGMMACVVFSVAFIYLDEIEGQEMDQTEAEPNESVMDTIRGFTMPQQSSRRRPYASSAKIAEVEKRHGIRISPITTALLLLMFVPVLSGCGSVWEGKRIDANARVDVAEHDANARVDVAEHDANARIGVAERNAAADIAESNDRKDADMHAETQKTERARMWSEVLPFAAMVIVAVVAFATFASLRMWRQSEVQMAYIASNRELGIAEYQNHAAIVDAETRARDVAAELGATYYQDGRGRHCADLNGEQLLLEDKT